jgi:hypothetical protein
MANSSAEDCLKIDDKDKRLECYDTYFSNNISKSVSTDSTKSNLKPTKWVQKFKEDPMTGITSQVVSIESDNTHSFGFPYEGAQRATLQIYNSGENTDEYLYFYIKKGQILCREHCSLYIKIDNKKPFLAKGFEPGDGSSNYTWFLLSAESLRDILGAKKVLIQPTIYQNGDPIFEFSVENNPYKPKKSYLKAELNEMLINKKTPPELKEIAKESSPYIDSFEECIKKAKTNIGKLKQGEFGKIESTYSNYEQFTYLEEKSKNKISYYTYDEKTVTQNICDKKENFFGYITYEYK